MNVNTWKCYDPVKNNDFWWYKEYNNKFKNNYPWDHER